MKLWYIYLLYIIVDEPQQRMVVSARSENDLEWVRGGYGDQFNDQLNLKQYERSQYQEYERKSKWHQKISDSFGMNIYFYSLED